MRKTKKILAGILAAVLVTGLAGCGASSPEKTGSSDRTKVSMVIFGGIILTNVVEEHYQLVYYMKASGNYAAITFFFNGKGFINYAAPLSDIGEADIKLSQLIEKLT